MSAKVFRKRPFDFNPSVEVAATYLAVGDEILFLRSDKWGAPAGKLEKGEAPLDAAKRELFEETGIQVTRLKALGPVYVRHPNLDFTYHMFTCDLEEKPQVKLSDEHSEFTWKSLSQAKLLNLIPGELEVLEHVEILKPLPSFAEGSFYLLRHGQTDVNASPCQKRVDYDLPLNALGIEQALLAREEVAKLNLGSISYSPIQRAVQTKDIVAEGLNIREYVEPGVGECTAAIWNKMVLLEEGSGYTCTEDVRSFIRKVLVGVEKALLRPGPQLIVAHGGVHFAIAYALGLDLPWKIENCKLVKVEITRQKTCLALRG